MIEVEIPSAVLGEELLAMASLCRYPKVMFPRTEDGLLPVQNGRDVHTVDQEVEAAEVSMTQDVRHGLRPGSLDGSFQPQDVRRHLTAAVLDPWMVESVSQAPDLRFVHRASRQVDAVEFVDLLQRLCGQAPVIIVRRPASDERETA